MKINKAEHYPVFYHLESCQICLLCAEQQKQNTLQFIFMSHCISLRGHFSGNLRLFQFYCSFSWGLELFQFYCRIKILLVLLQDSKQGLRILLVSLKDFQQGIRTFFVFFLQGFLVGNQTSFSYILKFKAGA